MAAIYEPQAFFNIQSVFFRWRPIFLGLFEQNLERVGILREAERWMSQLVHRDCDNPQRLPTIRDGGLIGTPDAIVTRSRGRRRNRNRFVFKPSSHLIPRTIFRVSRFSRPGSLLRPVPCAVHSADRLFIPFFFSSTPQTSIATLSVRGYVSSPSRDLALQRFGKLVKSFNSWACSLQKVTDTLDHSLFSSNHSPTTSTASSP